MPNLSKALATPCFGVVLAAALLLPGAGAAAGGSEWPSAGGNRQNTRFQETEHTLSVANVGGLQREVAGTTAGDVSATPAVDANTVYVPDWAGNLYAVDRQTGVGQVDGEHPRRDRCLPRQGSRHSRGDRRQGDRRHAGLCLRSRGGPGARILAFDKLTGALVWKHARWMTHFAAIITQSATVFDGRCTSALPHRRRRSQHSCPDTRCRSAAACSRSTSRPEQSSGRRCMAPRTAGYTGNAIWGSSPAIDTKRGQVYIATGNNYSVPPVRPWTASKAAGQGLRQAGVLARGRLLRQHHGAGHEDRRDPLGRPRRSPYDAWTVDCIPFFGDGDLCPEPAGPDFDFGQAPALYKTKDSQG